MCVLYYSFSYRDCYALALGIVESIRTLDIVHHGNSKDAHESENQSNKNVNPDTLSKASLAVIPYEFETKCQKEQIRMSQRFSKSIAKFIFGNLERLKLETVHFGGDLQKQWHCFCTQKIQEDNESSGMKTHRSSELRSWRKTVEGKWPTAQLD